MDTRLILFTAFLLCFSNCGKSQNLSQIEDSINKVNRQKPFISSTWKDTRLLDLQTTKTTSPGIMEFTIMHRFGNVGIDGGGDFQTLYGLDIASDILFDFEFGITKKFMVALSRSKEQGLIDITAKYRLLDQATSGIPFSLALYGDMGITPETNSQLYAFADSTVHKGFFDRISYLGEAIIDRRFNDKVSLELLMGDQHRNYILQSINSNNGATDQNDLPFIGGGGRIMINKHASIIFDAYYVISKYRTSNTENPYYEPISLGYEVETGGHVFQIFLSNASFLNENNIIPNTSDTWTKGGFKLGFSISRAFDIGKK